MSKPTMEMPAEDVLPSRDGKGCGEFGACRKLSSAVTMGMSRQFRAGSLHKSSLWVLNLLNATAALPSTQQDLQPLLLCCRQSMRASKRPRRSRGMPRRCRRRLTGSTQRRDKRKQRGPTSWFSACGSCFCCAGPHAAWLFAGAALLAPFASRWGLDSCLLPGLLQLWCTLRAAGLQLPLLFDWWSQGAELTDSSACWCMPTPESQALPLSIRAGELTCKWPPLQAQQCEAQGCGG